MRTAMRSASVWQAATGMAAAGLLAAGCATGSGGGRAAAPAAPTAERTKALAQLEKKERLDDFDHMIVETSLDGPALAGFMGAVNARLENLARYDADPEKGAAARAKLAAEAKAAGEAGNADKAAALQAQAEALDKAYWTYRTRQRAEVMAMLPRAEQTAWVARSLNGQVLRALRKANPDDAQKARIAAACTDVAADCVGKGIVDSDPYLRTLRGEPLQAAVSKISASILTDDQRKALEAQP